MAITFGLLHGLLFLPVLLGLLGGDGEVQQPDEGKADDKTEDNKENNNV